jgi:hypothetical protein
VVNTTGVLTIFGNTFVGGNVNQTDAASGGSIGFYGNLQCMSVITIAGASDAGVYGDCEANAITITKDAFYVVRDYKSGSNAAITAGCSFTVDGKVQLVGLINAGAFSCLELNSGAAVDNTGATGFNILGNMHVKGTFTNTTCVANISGNAYFGQTFSQVDATGVGSVGVYGRAFFDGDCTVNGGYVELDGGCHINILTIILGEVDTFDDSVVTTDVNVGPGTIFLAQGGTLKVGHNISNTGTITCLSLECSGNVDNTGATSFTVYGDCNVGGTFTNGVCTTEVFGALWVGNALTNNGGILRAARSIDVGGDLTNTTGTTTGGPINVRGDVNCLAGTINAYGGILLAGTLTNTGTINNVVYHYP